MLKDRYQFLSHLIIYLWCLFLIIAPSVAGEVFASSQGVTASFYVGSGGNGYLTDDTLQFIADKSPEIVTLSIRRDAENDYFDYSSIVRRLKKIKPEIKTLGYGSITMTNNSERIGGFFWDYFQQSNIPENYFLHKLDADGNPIIDPDDRITWENNQNYYQMNIYNDGYKQLRVEAVKEFFKEFPQLDGIFFDETYVFGGTYAKYYPKDQQFIKEYSGEALELLRMIKKALPNKLIVYNGLAYDHNENNLTPGEIYLDVADGAAIEFFCGTNSTLGPEKKDFSLYVKPYLEVMSKLENENKIFLVYGRGGETQPYQVEYKQAKYCLASFLLGKTPHSYFSFFKGIEASLFSSRKFSGMDYYDLQDINVGDPYDNYAVTNGIYHRQFSNGYVAVAPDDLPSTQTLELDRTYYDLSGKKYSQLSLKPGEAEILTTNKPCNYNSSCEHGERYANCSQDCNTLLDLDFENEEGFLPFQLYPEESVVGVEYSPVLKSNVISVSPEAPLWSFENWHHLILDRYSRSSAPNHLSFKINSSDPNLVLNIHLQADDGTKGKLHYPIISLLPRTRDFIEVQDHPITSYESTKKILMGIGQDLNWGEWKNIHLDLNKLLDRVASYQDAKGNRPFHFFSNYTVHKVDGIDIHGEFKIDDLVLSYEPINLRCNDTDYNCDNTTNLLDLLQWRRNLVTGETSTQPTGILGYLQILRGWLGS